MGRGAKLLERPNKLDVAQNGGKINLEDYKVGINVYFYKPPSASEAERKGRKAKHMDHY